MSVIAKAESLWQSETSRWLHVLRFPRTLMSSRNDTRGFIIHPINIKTGKHSPSVTHEGSAEPVAILNEHLIEEAECNRMQVLTCLRMTQGFYTTSNY